MKSFVILLILVIKAIALDPYDDQPKILVNDGNLIFESADSKDVRVKLNGRSKFIVNDIDILNTFYRQNNTAHLTPINSDVLSSLLRQVTNLQRTVRNQNTRIARLENGGGGVDSGNSSGTQLIDRRRFNMLQRRIKALEVKVFNMTERLTKNHCASYPCQNGGTCFNMFDTFRCECPENWEGPTCNLDVNECARYVGTDLGCQNGATCVNTVGSYECSCTQGWKGKNCNRNKVDCLSVPQSEICGQGTCVSANNKDGYTCICKQGWRQGNVTQACTQDVDECNEMKPHCSVDPKVFCINTPGSFVCGPCPPGYTGNGFYCEDIDECQINNGGCSIAPRVNCINTRGSFRCDNCPFGFEGDGKTCTATSSATSRPINTYQCSDSSICNVNALCYQYPNSPVNCICKAGYTGNGFGENGCIISSSYDPCSTLFCRNGGTCVRNGTFASCQCPNGTKPPVCMREYDSCSPNPCLNGGSCSQVPIRYGTRYRCSCLPGFTGNRCQQSPGCGRVLTDANGTLKYPPDGGNYLHNIKCAWLIKTNLTKVLNITFKSFNLEVSNDCRFDWLQIHDGRSAASHIIGRFCGNRKPNGGNIISTHNSIYLWFRSDNSTSHDGFELTWDSIDPVCGGEFNITSHGTIASPGSPGPYPMNSECEWHLRAPPGKRIQFLFYTLKIESHVNCSYDYLEVHSGATIDTPSLGKFCNSTIPPPLLTPGNLATIHFHSDGDSNDAGFQIAYSIVEGIPGCGGTFTASKGDISSPSNPEDGKYKHNLLCDYVIRMPVGTRIRLEFIKFELEDSVTCKFDKLEIFEGLGSESEEGLIGRYCGINKPPLITSQTNVVTIKFTSDWSASEEGFLINYKLICGGIYTAESGVISSPNYPNNYEGDRNCEYEIRAPMGKIIVLNILDLDIEQHSTCDFDYLEIFNGPFADNSTSMGKFCGDFKPGLFTSFNSKHNVLRVHFTTDPSVFGRGFQANYTFVDIQCGGIISDERELIKPPLETDASGFYQSNAKCQWLVYAPKGFVIQINVLNFELELDSQCKYDFVKIFNNASENGEVMGPFCGTNIPKVITTTSNFATILFQSDSSTAKDGFTIGFNFIEASRQCGGTYFLQTGVLKSPGSPAYLSNKECEWILTVPNGQQIEVKFNYFDVEAHATCRFDGLEIRNGGNSLAPLINKFCGDKVPPPFKSMSNQLYLKFYSDSSRVARGFELEWDGTSFGCGGIVSQSKGAITSPNYPASYPHNAQCEWRISVNEGSSIQIVFSDLDMESHVDCKYDYLEIFDGSDASAMSFGKFCTNEQHPMHIETSGNHAMIRMSTDDSHSGRGFSIKYSAKCNRTIFADTGAIESPNFPEDYGNNIDCAWTIKVSKGNRVNMQFSHFALENDNLYHNETNEHECKYDYVRIYDYDYEAKARNGDIKTYCNGPPEIRNSTTDAVVVLFHTDPAAVDTGFRLEWYNEGCGGHLTKQSGTLLSPNFPRKYDHELVCIWEIDVSYGQSIEFTVNELELESSDDCKFDYLLFANDKNFSDVITKLCRPTHEPLKFTAQRSRVFVKFESDESEKQKGFNVSYKASSSVCGGSFLTPNGIIKTVGFPTKNYDNNQTCEWHIQTDPSHTISFQLTDFDIEKSENCSKDYLEIVDPFFQKVLWKGCGNDLPNTTFRSKRNMMDIRLVTDGTQTAKGFIGNFSKNCGARIVTSDSGELIYRKNTNEKICTWTISAEDPSKHVALTFSYLHLIFEYAGICFADVSVYEGDMDSLGALKAKFCGTKVPPTIFSIGNSLTIVMNTTTLMPSAEFDIHYSVADNACGGTYRSYHGEFGSPNYPNTSPLNSYCIWKIPASEGNKIALTIQDLDIASSQNCNDNYLEVREGNETGNLIGAYCGTEKPVNLPTAAGYWLKYKTDDQSPNKGFFAKFNYADISDVTGTSGIMQSPIYPKFLRSSAFMSYRISVKQGYLINLVFNDLITTFDEEDEECYSSLKIFDGYDDTAPLIEEYCTENLPEPIISETNVLFIKYTSLLADNSRFQITWTQIEKNETEAPATSGCPKDQVISLSSVKEVKNITSPGYPYGYEMNLDCQWTIVSTIPSHRPVLEFVDINMEAFDNCIADYVTVERSREDGSWIQTAKKCEMAGPLTEIYKGTPSLRVKFKSDYNRNETGFNATVSLGCGGVFTEPEGVIEFANNFYYRNIEMSCMWNITVRRGRTIQFEFLQMNLKNETGPCDSHVVIRNGIDNTSPILGDGKYCGTVTAQIPPTSSNRAFVEYNANRYHSLNAFKIRYHEVQHECGGEIRLNTITTNATISTPNYPSIPQPHIQCIWTILGPVGNKLRIDFLERFDLSKQNDKEYVEFREGSTASSPLIKTLWGEGPKSTIYTKSNLLRIKYFTDAPIPNNGFKAQISIGVCGGLLRAHPMLPGYLKSPNYPAVGAYPANATCDYRIVATNPNADFKVKILNIDLAEIGTENSSEEFYQNCSLKKDYLKIFSIIPDDNATDGESLIEAGLFCGSQAPNKTVLLNSNKILVRFQTFPKTPKVYKGFELTYKAELTRCGGVLNTDEGVITSPGYPNKIKGGNCEWRITVRSGRRIKFEFIDLDLTTSEDRFLQRLNIYSDFRYRAKVKTISNATNPGPVSTSDNIALVSWYVRAASNNRGFKIKFTSDEPTLCEGDLSRNEGFIYPPANVRSYTCYYKRPNIPIIAGSTVGTIALYFTNLDFGSEQTNCEFPRATISVWRDSDPGNFLAVLCRNETKKTVLSPWRDLTLMTRQTPTFVSNLNFTIQHKNHVCGGVHKGSMTISNISPSVANYAVLDCAWSLKFENDATIKLAINRYALKLPCDQEYINIYNGKSSSSPLMVTLCGEGTNDPIISQSSSLFITYHTDNFVGSSKDSVFNINALANDSPCGGILHKSSNNFQSPIEGNTYKPNTECIWELRSDDGYFIEVQFQGRFFIEQSDNCTKDYVEFQDYVDGEWIIKKRVCGRDIPAPVNSTSSRMKVIFRSDESGSGDGFNATWSQKCGGTILVDERTKLLSSPGYPKAYGDNLNCNYTFKAKNSESFINLKFLDFELEQTVTKCIYDNVTIYKKAEFTTFYTQVGSFCGKNNPGTFRHKSEILLNLRTDENFNLKGFQLEYSLDSCGGWIRNNSVISSPKIVKNRDIYEYIGPLTCTWNISAPKDYNIVIRFERLNMQFSEYCSFEYVQIIKGSVDDDKKSILRMCNNLTMTQLKTIHVEDNEAIIKMRSDQTHDWVGFSALVIFQRNCNEKINLTKQNPTKVLNKLDLNQNNLDCNYKVSAEPLSVIKVTFNEMHLSDCYANSSRSKSICECDYLEFYDGPGPFSNFIGRFCGHDTQREIFSTGSSIFVRYTTDATITSMGFKLTFMMIESPCGSQPFYNFTGDESKVVTLSQSNYPPNMRCMYLFEAPFRLNFEVQFTKFDLEDSENCTKDFLKIEDDAVKDYITEGLGEEITYRGASSYATNPNFYMGVVNPLGAHIYCGSTLPHEYFSQSSKLRIYFQTDSANEKSGFTLTVRTVNACSRNYTSLTGRLNSGIEPENCKTTITVPDDYTISLYFYRFFFIMNDCEKSFMKIYDGTFENGELMGTYCGYSQPTPLFSKGSLVSIWTKYDNSSGGYQRGSFDIFYIASKKSKGQGCGGEIYNYGGYFTSPLYPSSNRTTYNCTWTISVPQNLKVAMKFSVFDMGTKLTCNNDYVEILEPNESKEFVSIKRYCGDDKPAVFVSTSSQIKINYMQTVNFAGTGWTISFMGVNEGATPQEW